MPNRILMASASVGGGTFTAWNRRSSERSFSIDLRYSPGVVAPMHWISPRDSAGFKMLAASSVPSAAPAPTIVCSSSMKIMAFWFSINSFMMFLSRDFELAAVLGAGDNQCEVERQDALGSEKRR